MKTYLLLLLVCCVAAGCTDELVEAPQQEPQERLVASQSVGAPLWGMWSFNIDDPHEEMMVRKMVAAGIRGVVLNWPNVGSVEANINYLDQEISRAYNLGVTRVVVPIPFSYILAKNMPDITLLVQGVDALGSSGKKYFYIDEPALPPPAPQADPTVMQNIAGLISGRSDYLYIVHPDGRPANGQWDQRLAGATALMPDPYPKPLTTKQNIYLQQSQFKPIAPIIGLTEQPGVGCVDRPNLNTLIQDIQKAKTYTTTGEVWFYEYKWETGCKVGNTKPPSYNLYESGADWSLFLQAYCQFAFCSPAVSLTLTGPTQLNLHQTATYTMSASGGNGTYLYTWRQRYFNRTSNKWEAWTLPASLPTTRTYSLTVHQCGISKVQLEAVANSGSATNYKTVEVTIPNPC